MTTVYSRPPAPVVAQNGWLINKHQTNIMCDFYNRIVAGHVPPCRWLMIQKISIICCAIAAVNDGVWHSDMPIQESHGASLEKPRRGRKLVAFHATTSRNYLHLINNHNKSARAVTLTIWPMSERINKSEEAKTLNWIIINKRKKKNQRVLRSRASISPIRACTLRPPMLHSKTRHSSSLPDVIVIIIAIARQAKPNQTGNRDDDEPRRF